MGYAITSPIDAGGHREMPFYRGRPITGCLADMIDDRTRFLFEGHAKYGETFRSHIFGRSLVFTCEPELVNGVNVTHWQSFHKPKHVKLMWKPFLGQGLVPNDGESWKRQHKLIRPGFHKQRIDAYAETMVAFTERLLDSWEDGEQRDVRADMLELALQMVAKTLFDLDIAGAATETIHEAMVDISRILATDSDKLFPRPRWWPSRENRRKNAAIAAMEEVVWSAVEQRRATGEDRGDLLSHMVFVEDAQGPMTDEQLRDEAMTLVFAGHETTAHALTWAYHLLATHPEVAAKLRDELREVLGDRPVTAADLPQLEYLTRVIKETLRLEPSVWAYARETIEDVTIAGYHLPKGTTVTVSHVAMARNDRYYARPDEFVPERWTREFEKGLPKGAYAPFAGGPRVCLGKQFAMMEMQIVLATMVRRFEPRLVEGFEPDFVTELARHPGERGMQIRVRPW